MTSNPNLYLKKIQTGCIEPVCKLSEYSTDVVLSWPICIREITHQGMVFDPEEAVEPPDEPPPEPDKPEGRPSLKIVK